MKRTINFFLIILLITTSDVIAQLKDDVGHTVTQWSDWSTTGCHKGIAWRSRQSFYTGNSNGFTWEYEVKNNYGRQVTFSFKFGENGTGNRKTLTPNQVYRNTALPNSNYFNYSVYSVCFSSDGRCKDDCYSPCDDGTPNIPNCNNSSTSLNTNSNSSVSSNQNNSQQSQSQNSLNQQSLQELQNAKTASNIESVSLIVTGVASLIKEMRNKKLENELENSKKKREEFDKIEELEKEYNEASSIFIKTLTEKNKLSFEEKTKYIEDAQQKYLISYRKGVIKALHGLAEVEINLKENISNSAFLLKSFLAESNSETEEILRTTSALYLYRCYIKGDNNLHKNEDEAFKWLNIFESNILQLYTKKDYAFMGEYYLNEGGVIHNYKKALSYFESYDEKLYPIKFMYLGKMYLNGWGVEKNEKKGLKYIEKACSKKVKSACEIIDNFRNSLNQINSSSVKEPIKKEELLEINPKALDTVNTFIKWENSDFGTFTDIRDNKKYKVVKIGNQTWIGENINYEPKTGNFSQLQINSLNNIKQVKFYDFDTANNVCPDGWKLPNSKELIELYSSFGKIGYLDGEQRFKDFFGKFDEYEVNKTYSKIIINNKIDFPIVKFDYENSLRPMIWSSDSPKESSDRNYAIFVDTDRELLFFGSYPKTWKGICRCIIDK